MSGPLSADRLRSLALTLYGLDRRDQAWLLRRLLPGVRLTLLGLLRELRSLGFSRHMGLATVDLPAVAENLGLNQDDVSEIDQADAGLVGAILMRQPDMVQRALLHARPWRWRGALWERLGPVRRNLLLDPVVMANAMPGCRLDALLFAFVHLLHAEKAAAAMAKGGQP